MIVPYTEKVTLLGGGEVSSATLSEVLSYAPNLVACDGAARVALLAGHMPDLVIGDMDSLDAASRAMIDPARLLEISEQDSTDFDKALRTLEAPMILAAGVLGRRMDHALAAMTVLVRRSARACVLVGDYDVVFALRPGETVELPMEAGARVSLFPVKEVVVSGRGLVWPLDRLCLSPWGQVGTSNKASGAAPVVIEAEGEGLVVLLARDQLGAVIEMIEGFHR